MQGTSPSRYTGHYLTRTLILKYDTVHITAKLCCKPVVLNNSQLYNVTCKWRIKVCVYGAAHSFQHNEISFHFFHAFAEIIINVPATQSHSTHHNCLGRSQDSLSWGNIPLQGVTDILGSSRNLGPILAVRSLHVDIVLSSMDRMPYTLLAHNEKVSVSQQS